MVRVRGALLASLLGWVVLAPGACNLNPRPEDPSASGATPSASNDAGALFGGSTGSGGFATGTGAATGSGGLNGGAGSGTGGAPGSGGTTAGSGGAYGSGGIPSGDSGVGTDGGVGLDGAVTDAKAGTTHD